MRILTGLSTVERGLNPSKSVFLISCGGPLQHGGATQDAEAEQAQKGDASELHVIIFDEIDAICKQRGSVSSGSGVHDTVVNQLLTKIDGVDALNNILLIGMTNR